MIEVKSRSPEAWGPLAEDKCTSLQFLAIVNHKHTPTKIAIKDFVARKKKLKEYKIRFIQELMSDEFTVEAENEYDVRSAAANLFKIMKSEIAFKTKPYGKWAWAGGYSGYDRISYVKVSK
jgi:hypothetical protein